MKVLVTGGAGYIGSHACKALARAGHIPISYDNLFRGHEWAVKWGPLERGDITDAARLREVLATHQPDAVMHFAALAYAGESVQQAQRYHDNNVGGTQVLLDAMLASGVNSIVFSGSCSVYGDAAAQPITESAPMQPVSPYGQTKLDCERLLQRYQRELGLRFVSLRYFNASGCDADGDTGEVHDPETHLIPLVLDVAAGKRPHIQVFGADYPTPDGSCVRDYIHVSDLAAAHVLALGKLNRDAPHLITSENRVRPYFNLGTGKGHSVLQVIEAARKVTGHPIPVVMQPRRPGDPAEAYADASLARRELGWLPQYTELEPILRTAWAWVQRKH